MIGISFSLTPAQTKMLLAIVYEHFEGDLCLPSYRSGRNDFVTIVGGLTRRGLVEHDSNRCPSYVATDAGKGLATAIIASCEEMLGMTKNIEQRRKAWKPVADNANRLKAEWIKRRAKQEAGR